MASRYVRLYVRKASMAARATAGSLTVCTRKERERMCRFAPEAEQKTMKEGKARREEGREGGRERGGVSQ